MIKGGRGEGGTYTNTMGDQKGLREDKREQQLCEACKRKIKGRKEHYLSNCAKNRFAVRIHKKLLIVKLNLAFSPPMGAPKQLATPTPADTTNICPAAFSYKKHMLQCVCGLFFRLLCFKERSRISFIVFQRSISHPV